MCKYCRLLEEQRDALPAPCFADRMRKFGKWGQRGSQLLGHGVAFVQLTGGKSKLTSCVHEKLPFIKQETYPDVAYVSCAVIS